MASTTPLSRKRRRIDDSSDEDQHQHPSATKPAAARIAPDTQQLSKAPEASSLQNMANPLQNMTSMIDDVRSIVTCKICFQLLYEPYTILCGHTFCYSCLCEWFSNGPRRKKTCPSCRIVVLRAPAPAYLVREMTLKLIQHDEFLPDGETKEKHEEWKTREADAVERDRANTDPLTGGVFPGLFQPEETRNRMNRPIRALRDHEDGVERCPHCHWELEELDGTCAQCGGQYATLNQDDVGSTVDSIELWERSRDPPSPRRPNAIQIGESIDSDSEEEDEELDGDIDLDDEYNAIYAEEFSDYDRSDSDNDSQDPATRRRRAIRDLERAAFRHSFNHRRTLQGRDPFEVAFNIGEAEEEAAYNEEFRVLDARLEEDEEEDGHDIESGDNVESEERYEDEEEEEEGDSEEEEDSLDGFIEDDMHARVHITEFDSDHESSDSSGSSSATEQAPRVSRAVTVSSDEDDSDEGGRVTRGPIRRSAAPPRSTA